jgi:hypothetical protein
MTTRAEHFQAGAEQDDRYHGESDRQYKARKEYERRMAEHTAKYGKPADPFAGIPGAPGE